MKKNFLISLGLMLTFFAGAFIGSAAGFDPMTAGAVVAGASAVKYVWVQFVPSMQLPKGLAFDAIDLTELSAALGAYHREHRDELVSELLLDEDFTGDLNVYDDVTDELPLPSLALEDLTKPADPVNFTPTANALKFGARILKVRPVKVDLLLVPQVLEKSWLGKLKKSSDPMEMPFEKFIMDYINSKITEEIRLMSVYKGVYNAAGVTPTDNFTGYLKLVADEITATNITPVVTGAITYANVIDKVELTHDALGDAYKNKPSIMKASPTIFDWYNRKYRELYGANNNYSGMKPNRVTLDGTNCELVKEPGLSGSQRLLVSPVENFAYGVDTTKGYNMDVQKFNRSLKILIDLKAGVQLAQIHSRALAVNDQV